MGVVLDAVIGGAKDLAGATGFVLDAVLDAVLDSVLCAGTGAANERE